jgi:hypothetical protein
MSKVADDTLTEHRYADGPKFVEWLQHEGVAWEGLSHSEKKMWRLWEGGKRVDTFTDLCDNLLMDRGLAARWIPDKTWANDQKPKRRGVNKN